MEEIWKPVVGFEGYYEVSSLGRFRSLERVVKTVTGKLEHRKSRILSQMIAKSGYAQVILSKGGKPYYFRLARLIAASFFGNPASSSMQVNHKNGIKLDNRVENLEWVTPGENQEHAYRTGLKKRRDRAVICIEDGQKYSSITKAAAAIGGRPFGICHVLSGKQKHYKRKSFVYAD